MMEPDTSAWAAIGGTGVVMVTRGGAALREGDDPKVAHVLRGDWAA